MQKEQPPTCVFVEKFKELNQVLLDHENNGNIENNETGKVSLFALLDATASEKLDVEADFLGNYSGLQKAFRNNLSRKYN